MSNWRAATLPLLASLALSGVNGCSWVVDAERVQCSNDADCAGLGVAFENMACVESLCRLKPDPVWGCLGDGEVMTPPTRGRVRIVATLTNIVTRMPGAGIEVRACERLDSACVTPVAGGITDGSGAVGLDLVGGFNGFLLLQAEDLFPTMFFFGSPQVADARVAIDVITPGEASDLNAQFQGIALEDRGTVVAYVASCIGAPAEGVHFSIPEGDAATRAFYLLDGLFPASQTETSAGGIARVINVPPGNVTITASLADGREIETAAVVTRPGYATLINMRPPAAAP